MRREPRHQRITIRAVAERAGVSAMTVSNVVNGVGRASQATIASVRAAIGELGYIPNVTARRLSGARATTVGVMYNEGRTPFLDAILVGALRATNARGMQLVLHAGERMERVEAEAACRSLIRRGVDAFLLVPPFAELLGRDLFDAAGMPVAALATGGPLPGIATVRIDNRAAMVRLTRLVVARGHRRIGYVAGPATSGDAVQRTIGFREAMTAAGLDIDAALMCEGDFGHRSGIDAAERLLERADPPTAIMCANDEMAAGVVAEALRRRLRMPDDLAVTGFDDTPVASRIFPPLTVASQPVERMAFRAVEILLEMLTYVGPDVARDEVLPFELVERDSLADVTPHAPAPGVSPDAR